MIEIARELGISEPEDGQGGKNRVRGWLGRIYVRARKERRRGNDVGYVRATSVITTGKGK